MTEGKKVNEKWREQISQETSPSQAGYFHRGRLTPDELEALLQLSLELRKAPSVGQDGSPS